MRIVNSDGGRRLEIYFYVHSVQSTLNISSDNVNGVGKEEMYMKVNIRN